MIYIKVNQCTCELNHEFLTRLKELFLRYLTLSHVMLMRQISSANCSQIGQLCRLTSIDRLALL